MRVLHINGGNLFGGVEVLLLTLAHHRALTPEVEPEFALCFAGRARDELAAAGVPAHVLGPARVSRPWTVWRVRRRLRALLRQRRCDVAVCHGAWVQTVCGPAVRAAGVPLALWLHDPPEGRLNWIEYWASRSAPDVTICNSDYTHARLGRLYPGGRGQRVHCPVSLTEPAGGEAERRVTRAAFGAAADSAVLLQVGRWEPHKGHALLMEALGQLAGEPGWVCWQVGGVQRPHEEAYLRGVREAARRHGVAERVRFLGYQPDLPRLLAAADVYCQPNVRPEPFGIAVVEALGAGLPVVATALGGPKEVVDEGCGILVPAGDAGSLARALGRLIREPERRRRLGQAGPARARAVSDPAARLRELSQIIRGLCAGRPAPPDGPAWAATNPLPGHRTPVAP
jgi:glycosyltransferase involved in cell wall biosynthesis